MAGDGEPLRICVYAIAKNEAQFFDALPYLWHLCGMKIDDLQLLFSYDLHTGNLYWRSKGRGRIKKKPAGTLLSTGYIGVVCGERRYLAHRVCWALHTGQWPDQQIDHINGIKTDNRISNLRLATNSQNGKNISRSINNTSGVCGVTYDKANKKWRALIKVDAKQIHLGRWSDFDDAIKARKLAEKKYFGDWARKDP